MAALSSLAISVKRFSALSIRDFFLPQPILFPFQFSYLLISILDLLTFIYFLVTLFYLFFIYFFIYFF